MTTYSIISNLANYTTLFEEEAYTLSHTALQARVKGIAGEESQQLRLALEPLAPAILLAQRHESRQSTNRLRARLVDVVDVVVVQDAQVRG